jgi:hypothetical membrane protein
MDLNAAVVFIQQAYPYFGIGGSLLIIASMLAAGLVYRGKDGERYSVLNHYISELGEVGVSRAAPIFNLGLIIGSLAFIPFITGLTFTLDNLWAKIGLAIGIWSTLSCVLVGVFPMNHMEAHKWVAVSYFRSGLVMVLLYSIAVFVQPATIVAIPKISNVAGLLAFFCYAAFLFTMDTHKKKDDEPETLETESEKEWVRPKVSRFTILEWAISFSNFLWFLIVALFALR